MPHGGGLSFCLRSRRTCSSPAVADWSARAATRQASFLGQTPICVERRRGWVETSPTTPNEPRAVTAADACQRLPRGPFGQQPPLSGPCSLSGAYVWWPFVFGPPTRSMGDSARSPKLLGCDSPRTTSIRRACRRVATRRSGLRGWHQRDKHYGVIALLGRSTRSTLYASPPATTRHSSLPELR
jgi:hypothetical protein